LGWALPSWSTLIAYPPKKGALSRVRGAAAAAGVRGCEPAASEDVASAAQPEPCAAAAGLGAVMRVRRKAVVSKVPW
jgi:hypothetical protein